MEILRNNKNLFFAVLAFLVVLPSLVYLVSRSTRVDSWDNWYSVQTMLTLRYWARDGLLEHKALWICAGYHPEIKIFDKPEFRSLAGSGIATGGLIGQRLYYTHYSPGSAVPFFLLAKSGIENRFLYRLLATALSLGSVLFLGGFAYLITDRNHWISLLAVFYYITSSNFLGYADAVSTMTPDDFYRNLILFLSVFSWKCVADEKLKKKLKIFMWAVYFILAISSYDSTFFIFFWLCALNFIETRKFNFKEYFYWAMAPVLAFILQIAQNTWYLGWKDMLLDFWGAFAVRSSEAPVVLGSLPPVIKNIFASLSTAGYLADLRTRFILPLILIIVYLLWRKRVAATNFFYVVLALFGAGMIYGIIFPVAGTFGYQGRQLAPALLLLFGMATYETIKMIKEKKLSLGVLALAVCMAIVWSAHFYGAYVYAKDWPNNVFPKEKIAYLEKIKEISDPSTIILRTNSNIVEGDRNYEQFYADRLVLSFDNPDILFEYMDKLHIAMPGKVNFLLMLTDEEYQRALKKFKSIKEYTATQQIIDSLPENFNLIKIVY